MKGRLPCTHSSDRETATWTPTLPSSPGPTSSGPPDTRPSCSARLPQQGLLSAGSWILLAAGILFRGSAQLPGPPDSEKGSCQSHTAAAVTTSGGLLMRLLLPDRRRPHGPRCRRCPRRAATALSERPLLPQAAAPQPAAPTACGRPTSRGPQGLPGGPAPARPHPP